MNILQAMVQLSTYFNEGDGQNADAKTKDAFDILRTFVTGMIGEFMNADQLPHA